MAASLCSRGSSIPLTCHRAKALVRATSPSSKMQHSEARTFIDFSLSLNLHLSVLGECLGILLRCLGDAWLVLVTSWLGSLLLGIILIGALNDIEACLVA